MGTHNRKLIDAGAFLEELRERHEEFRKSDDPLVNGTMAGTVEGIIRLLERQPAVAIRDEEEKEKGRHEKKKNNRDSRVKHMEQQDRRRRR